ncbi:MAG: polysaccharide biosynthesis tyrosine autokinase, partial [Bacteroidales bacterium]|nr:polysaccharide biosynthesis tyrosine autokinase [Bacteroidales bacterium]
MENNNNQVQNTENSESSINIRDLVFIVLNNWYWFVISVVVCVIGAAFIYKAQPKSYSAHGTILVRDDDNKRGYSKANMDAILSNMGMQGSGMSLENEMYMLRSSWLMSQVVSRLDLNHYCNRHDLFRKETYYKDAPVMLVLEDRKEGREASLGLQVSLKANNKYAYEGVWKEKKIKGEAYYNQPVNLDDTVTFILEKTPRYNDSFEGVKLNVGVRPVWPLARTMIGSLSVSRVDKMATILSISYTDSNPQRANDIVDTLIAVYNDDAVNDKNKVAQKTEEFIAERIALISSELGDVDAEVEQLKKQSNLGDFEGVSGQVLQSVTKYSEQVVQLEVEYRAIEYVKNYVSDPANSEQLLPANVAVSDGATQSMIASYNQLVNQYQKVKTTGGVNNPQVRNLKSQMTAQLAAINTSIDNLLKTTSMRLREARNQEARSRGQIAAIPTQTKAVTEVGRQQKIKEELYLYLLSKREETAMNLAITMANAKVVEPAIVGLKGPRLMMFALVALVLGLAIPAVVMFLINFFDTKLRSKADIEKMTSLPILGEIPSKPAARVNDEIIVTANGTDVVTEAFRLLHSNIPFFLKEGEKVIQTVSTTPGEGKSYTALNLALSLAYTGKRTLLADFDLRKRSLSKTIDRHNRMGLIHYLLDTEDNFEQYITHSETSDHLDYIVCEKTPPNATQLLMGDKLDKLVAYLRQHYDYIIFDSTPAQIVADAAIINRVSDLTAYIMRMGKLNKGSLPFIQEMSDKGRFKNMAVVITDVPLIKKRYGGYGYG